MNGFKRMKEKNPYKPHYNNTPVIQLQVVARLWGALDSPNPADKRRALAGGTRFASSLSLKALLSEANSAVDTDCGVLSRSRARFSITSSGLNEVI